MSEKKIIDGGCHCGNIRYHYEIDSRDKGLAIRACSCTFCTKQGALYTSDPEAKLTINVVSHADIEHYQFATKEVDFIFCRKCGVMPFVATEIGHKNYVVINIKTANIELGGLPVQLNDFESESINESIRRRESKWVSRLDGNLWK